MNQPEIILPQGILHGIEATSYNGVKYYKFQGIPYAKPPLGQLRFKAPEPLEKWNGILDASKERSQCYSKNPFSNQIQGSEDCLFLNVYTKNCDTENLKPVLFWIHGGGFIEGSSSTDTYGPDFFIEEDIILITINYRLGIFGFLALEDPSLEIPGNAGLKDIVMGLNWVQKNVSKFGGDPNNVTIFGQSSGATAVHLLMLSKMGKNLFHKAIAQSGCALLPTMRGTTGVREITSLQNQVETDEKNVYNNLMTLTTEKLYQIQNSIVNFQNICPNERRAFGFVVEKGCENPFLDNEPLDIIKSGNFTQVPFIIGYNSAETIILRLYRKTRCLGEKTMENIIPWDWGYKSGSAESLLVIEKIAKFYFGERESSTITKMETVPLFSDIIFIYSIHQTVLNQYPKSKTPIFLYRMDLETELNFMRQLFNIQIRGVVHNDELGYLFKNFATPEIKPESIEDTSMRKFVKLWTNLAKYGNPTPCQQDSNMDIEWEPVQSRNLEYLSIEEEFVMKSDPPEARRTSFLRSLYEESPHGQKLN